jgi:FMN-dependent dehydrogenase
VPLGRATLYGLAAAGEHGVDDGLAIMKDEIDRTLAQLTNQEIGTLSLLDLIEMQGVPRHSRQQYRGGVLIRLNEAIRQIPIHHQSKPKNHAAGVASLYSVRRRTISAPRARVSPSRPHRAERNRNERPPEFVRLAEMTCNLGRLTLRMSESRYPSYRRQNRTFVERCLRRSLVAM